ATRADGLVVGCLVALWRFRGVDLAKHCERLAVVGAPLVAYFVISTAPGSPARFLELPVATAVFGSFVYLAVENHKVARALTFPPLVSLGLVSYSLYLWHNPVLFALRAHGAFVGVRSVAALVLALAVSAVSTKRIEEPFRRKRERVGRAAVVST